VGQGTLDGSGIIYSADPGEANRVTVSHAGDRVLIDDPGAASIDAERGCVAVTATRVTCDHASSLSVDLGDGNDSATTTDDANEGAGFIYLAGEQGDDMLVGSAAASVLDGGVGSDVYVGGSGTESFNAVETIGTGSELRMPQIRNDPDRITCAAAAAGPAALTNLVDADAGDTIDGPCGQVLLYTKDYVLSRGTDGPDLLTSSFYPTRVYGLGGDDRLFGGTSSVSRTDGGPGNDQLEGGGLMIGGPGDDHFSAAPANDLPVREDGGPGDDVMVGRYGPDTLTGGPGKDRMSGGAGNDKINARDGERDSVRCGDGSKDRVDADRIDVVARDCERVTRHK
jgi:Ca2+-binding RTX toxin-like protein